MKPPVQFFISCYEGPNVPYGDPRHPRHGFSEPWDDGLHPRFDFERIQNGVERLLTRGYVLRIETGVLRIVNAKGDVFFEMTVA